jgi:ribosomal protein S18 acetylase RimI-like enzyme
MTENIEIRTVTIKDLDQLVQISISTFYETFSQENTEENIQKFIEESYSAEKILTELNNPNSQFYFVSYRKKIVGYLKINQLDAQTEKIGSEALEIERIYIKKNYQRLGIGQKLIQFTIDHARINSKYLIWLGVWSQNYSAIKFYKKLGFIEFGQHIFTLGNDEQLDLLMKLELT